MDKMFENLAFQMRLFLWLYKYTKILNKLIKSLQMYYSYTFHGCWFTFIFFRFISRSPNKQTKKSSHEIQFLYMKISFLIWDTCKDNKIFAYLFRSQFKKDSCTLHLSIMFSKLFSTRFNFVVFGSF